ncbi:tetratricopeptide repeat protein [Couchioplanes caeruleus]|uniref:AfsR/SARP family transcriptional regulator n=1 Tax=Couchioplanes caeruleus TaxID=56438 RepID=UPI0020C1439F|nr:AfsR/SARP family transcriptional regulator [Couchioplanes caeruleus]UQU65317.1 tetratricopeptide repeat protein [Couchioplanes caeruleus]
MRFGILGPLSVTDAGREVVVTAGRDRTVLAVLLLNAGRIVGVDQLIDAVWDHAPPATARGQLQTCVSRLRRVLPPDVIMTDPAGYGVAAGPDRLDAAEFTELVGRARAMAGAQPAGAANLYRTALALWRGPALAGIDSPAVRYRAAVLDEQYGAVLEDWIDLEIAAGREGDLVPELTGLVEQHPLRERLRAQLMLALYRAGRQSDALAEYRRARDLLHDQVGVEPGAALQDLHRRILTGDVGPAAGAASSAEPVRALPRSVGDFTGREETIERLLRAATDTGLLTIDGMAGSGKTTLALRVAEILTDRYPDAQLFLDLQGHSEGEPLTPDAALLALLRQLGLEAERIPPDPAGRATLWRTQLAGRRALVILDNAASSSQLTRLLPASPTTLTLVTSRRRLIGLDGGHPESLSVLTERDAVELLARIVGPRVAAEPEAAMAVARRCGGLPLAIRLAGARLAHRPGWRVADLLRRLGDAALPELAAEDRGVARAFAMSFEQLPERVQRVFRLLGRHPAERIGALSVAALAGLSNDDAQDVLDDLVDVNLVEEPLPGRYRLHDLVRQYAAGLAEALEPDEVHDALAGLVDLHLQVGSRLALDRESDYAHRDLIVEPPLRPELVRLATDDPQWPEEHRTDLVPLIRTAAAIGQPGRAWRLARVSWRLLYQSGYLADVVATCSEGLAAATEAEDEYGVAIMNNYLASGYFVLGRPDEALSRITVMLDYQLRTGNRSAEGRARANLSGVLMQLGRIVEGQGEGHRAYRLLQSEGHRSAPVVLRVHLGYGDVVAGRYREALRSGRIALQWFAESRSTYFVPSALILIGQARLHLGDLGAAERALEAALTVAREHRIHTEEAESTNLLGRAAFARGRPDRAVELHLTALEMSRERGWLPRLARYSNHLGLAMRAVDDERGAVELHRQALATARRANHPLEEGRALSGLAACLVERDRKAAVRHWRQALEIFERVGVPERFEVRQRLSELEPAYANSPLTAM